VHPKLHIEIIQTFFCIRAQLYLHHLFSRPRDYFSHFPGDNETNIIISMIIDTSPPKYFINEPARVFSCQLICCLFYTRIIAGEFRYGMIVYASAGRFLTRSFRGYTSTGVLNLVMSGFYFSRPVFNPVMQGLT
jgi:hypothetical protein